MPTNQSSPSPVDGSIHRRSTFDRRASSVAGPTERNSLPNSLRDPDRSTGGFRLALRKGTISALEALRDALYKSLFIVGGMAQWLRHPSLASGLSLIYA